ncbi:anti-sigma factor [Streptomyces sp. NBC_01341]|uniref:anti-sigma factor n=1 Tax=Streptomyces sp. NBC_01341 TaxID=2903831 RepID=UPI002E0F2439|nr:anti-sigma factor [Streptomyces sp. NBC_01341]
MITTDPHESSGAYVLHALPEEERRAFEAHMAGCESCRQEVAGLRRTAALLGRATAETPPDALRERVLGMLAATPQDPDPGDGPQATAPRAGLRRGRRSPARALRLALAASVAAILACLGLAGWQRQEASDARAAAQHAEQRQANLTKVLTAPDVRLASQGLVEGATASVTFSRSEDTATLAVSGLPRLPAGRTYEAWFMEDGTPVPAGLLSRDPGRQVTFLKGTLDNASAVALSIEPAGGSTRPTTVPLGAIPLPT